MMKLGKHPKRFGGPSTAFLLRKAAETPLGASVQASAGGLRIYLDDERPLPSDAWMLARNSKAFRDLVVAGADQIEQISLDWYLGTGCANGEADATWLAERFMVDPLFMPKLDSVYCHSSDREEAAKMARIIERALPKARRYEIAVMVGAPRRDRDR